MSYFEVSPCGTYLAFRGSYGYIHILSMKSKEMLFQFKMNGDVTSLCFSPDAKYLYSHGSKLFHLGLSKLCVNAYQHLGVIYSVIADVDTH